MLKTILMPATGNDTDAATYDAALAVARLFDAHIDALHVQVDPVEIAVNAASSGGVGGTLLEGLMSDLEEEIAARRARARRLFTDFCARETVAVAASPMDAGAGVSGRFQVETGQEPRWMATYGLTADLVVAPRGTPGNDATARSTLEAILLETGRPLLIPGGTASAAIGGPVTIAWKPTPQAARAVAFALPLLARAKEIAIVTVEEDGQRNDAERLAGYLAWHGLKAGIDRLAPGPDGGAETLLGAAAAKGGLLVMGGYGHTRLREWVFGGFTQHVLAAAPMPVLIAH